MKATTSVVDAEWITVVHEGIHALDNLSGWSPQSRFSTEKGEEYAWGFEWIYDIYQDLALVEINLRKGEKEWRLSEKTRKVAVSIWNTRWRKIATGEQYRSAVTIDYAKRVWGPQSKPMSLEIYSIIAPRLGLSLSASMIREGLMRAYPFAAADIRKDFALPADLPEVFK